VPGDGMDDPTDLGPRVTVLVVDDQASFRRAMRELVCATEGFELVGEASSGEEALKAVDARSPRLVIMDKRMPGIGGVEATRLLTARHPRLVVWLVSLEQPDRRVMTSCGASAFVNKRDLSTRVLRDLWRDCRP
jgi:two-component system, NarL family, invasion response regulator UvrY